MGWGLGKKTIEVVLGCGGFEIKTKTRKQTTHSLRIAVVTMSDTRHFKISFLLLGCFVFFFLKEESRKEGS